MVNETRNRRVTDKAGGVSFDAAEQAVRLERMDGEMRLLTERMSQGMQNVANTLADVQIGIRGCSTKVAELTGLQGAHDANKIAIDRVERTVVELGAKLDNYFDEFAERNDRRWEQHEHNRDNWRMRFEQRLEDVKSTAAQETRTVRETLIRSLGWGAGAGGLITVLASMFMWNLNDRFNNVGARFTGIDEKIKDVSDGRQYNRELIDSLKDKVHQVELYLAQGGRIPEQKYEPQQRKQNEPARKP